MQPNHNEAAMVPVNLGKLMKKLHSFADPVLEKYGLSRIHVHYLVFLHGCHQNLNAKELSDHLGVDKANTSRALNELLKRNLVLRTTDESKQQILELSKEGAIIAQELKETNKMEMDKLLSVLTTEERITLREILRKISQTL